jgi:hypothetical protein
MGIIAASRLRSSNPFKNVVAYYKMEETTGNLIDSVNAHNGVLFGDIARGITGIIDNGYEFEGTNDSRIELPISIYDDFNNNNYTISFWFKSSSTNVEFIIEDLRIVSGDGFKQRKIYSFINNGRLNFGFGDNDNNILLTSSVFSTNNWNFGQIKYNVSSNIELKLNNVSQATHTFVNAPINENPISIGIRRTDLALPYTGELDEISFINGQTTDAQDTELWNNGNGITY